MVGKQVIKRTPAAAKAEAEKAKRSQGNSAAVQQYLERHPDEHVWASDIMNATGLTKRQVGGAINYLRSTAGMTNIAIIRPGNAWRYRSLEPAKVVVPAKERVVVNAQADPEPKPYAGVDSAVEVRVVGGYPDGSLALSINGKPYYAKPLA